MLNFEEISCKYIKLRKILNSDIDDIKDVRRKGENEGFLTKTPDDLQVFSSWLDDESNNPTTLYLAILDDQKKFIGTVRIIAIDKNVFEWGSWALKSNLGVIISLNSIYAVYKIAIEVFKFNSCEFKVKSHNKSVLNLHIKSGASIIEVKEDLIYFKIERKMILNFLKKYENKFGNLVIVQ